MLLGRTANGLYWMNRYIERAENMARLVDAGLRMALTRTENAAEEWNSVLVSAGSDAAFTQKYSDYTAANVADFLLRDTRNPSSVMASIETARNNARMVRTALTRETWESINEAWMSLKRMLAKPIDERDLPNVLDAIKRETALIRGAFYGTMLRNEIFDFSQTRHLRRARRQHGAHPRREILRAVAVDLVGRLLARQLPVGIDPALGVGAPLLSLGLRSRLQADQHRRLSDPQRAHAALAGLLLPHPDGASADSWATLMASATPATRQSARPLAKLKVGSIKDIFDAGLHEFLDDFIRDNIGSATRSPRTTGSTEREAHAAEDHPPHRIPLRCAGALCCCSGCGCCQSAAPTQTVLSWALKIEGAREEVRFTDHFGNDTRLFSVEGEPRFDHRRGSRRGRDTRHSRRHRASIRVLRRSGCLATRRR